MRRSRLTVALYLALVFVSGVLLGGLGLRFYATQSVRASRPPLPPDQARRQYVEEMRNRLKLRQDQFQQLTEILSTTHERFRALRKKWAPEVKSIQEQQVTAIRAILDDGQKSEYEKMRRERDQRQGAGH